MKGLGHSILQTAVNTYYTFNPAIVKKDTECQWYSTDLVSRQHLYYSAALKGKINDCKALS